MKTTKVFVPLAVVLVCVFPGAQAADSDYPSRPVRIISPFPPGGGNDTICRTVAPGLTQRLKQQVIVENRPGAHAIVGTEIAATSPPDGYTIILIPSGHAVNAAL